MVPGAGSVPIAGHAGLRPVAHNADVGFTDFVHILVGIVEYFAAVGAELQAPLEDIAIDPQRAVELDWRAPRRGHQVDLVHGLRVLIGQVEDPAAVGAELQAVEGDIAPRHERAVELRRRAAARRDDVDFIDVDRVLIGQVEDPATVGAELQDFEETSPPATSGPLSFVGVPPPARTL